MIFNHTFDNLSKEDVALLNSYFDSYPYDSSAHTFLATYIWRNTHSISWQIFGNLLCLESRADLEGSEVHYMSFPLTRTGHYDKEDLKLALDGAKKVFESQGFKFRMSLIPESLVHYLTDIYGDSVVITHDREDDDYIYQRSDLESLAGRKLHSKKNHLNYFINNYAYEYVPVTPDLVDDVRDYIWSKNEYKLGETPEEFKEMLELETYAICEYLNMLKQGACPTILAGAIKIDDKIKAVELGEYANTGSFAVGNSHDFSGSPASIDPHENVIVHFEKADDRIRGLYQAINWEFVRHLPPEVKYINREEDMGLETLRKAKEAYRPIRMSQKYSAEFK